MNSIAFDIWSVLIIISIGQGLFVLFGLLSRKNKSLANNLLIAIVITIIWFQTEFLSIRLPLDFKVNIFYGTRFGSWFLIGPLFYFYTLALSKKNYFFKIRDWAHFSPFVIFALIIPLINSDFLGFRQVHYGMLTVFDNYKQVVTGFQKFYSFIFIAQFIHLAFYLTLSIKEINTFGTSLKNSFSNLDKINLKWLKNLSVLMITIMLFVTAFLILLFFTEIYRRHMDYIYVFPMTIFMYIVGYRLIKQEQVVKVEIPQEINSEVEDTEAVKYSKSSLNTDQSKEYLEKLQPLMEEEKLFLNNELKLQNLAEALDIPTHHLSQVINEQLNLNFYDFVNQHRINEAKQLIISEGYQKASLLEIAFEVGFNNKTSFTNAFKKYVGKTPSAYKKEQNFRNN